MRVVTMRAQLLLLVAHLAVTSAQHTYELAKSNAECMSENRDLGSASNLRQCADLCAAAPDCNFFVSGKGPELGRCHMEATKSSRCPEGYEMNDGFDFYRLRRTGKRGCTEELAPNYDAGATEDDGSCTPRSPCLHSADGTCANCAREHGCTSGTNDGYRNPLHDQIYASRVVDGAIEIDGSLRDWAGHKMDRCYSDVAFATASGEEVVFETNGGVWYGPDDFSVKFMLSWDSKSLYLAAEVTDDVLQVGETCYANGLQAAFEVGGRKSPMPGMLQATRSKDHDVSRLVLLNTGLRPHQLGTGAACSTEEPIPMGCCMHYELSQQADGFAKRSRAAVLRNPIKRVTVFEIAFDLTDIVGTSPVHQMGWQEGLRFGFSFLVNDGDESTSQQGWAGYYPHAMVHGWEGGQKQPWKVGTLQLAGTDIPPIITPPPPPCGSCTGWIFFGTFILAPLFTATAYGGFYVYRKRSGRGISRAASPLARSDMMGGSQPVIMAPPVSSTA